MSERGWSTIELPGEGVAGGEGRTGIGGNPRQPVCVADMSLRSTRDTRVKAGKVLRTHLKPPRGVSRFVFV